MYFDQRQVLRDIPLLPITDPAFAPGLILRTGGGVDALRLDNIRIALVDRQETFLDGSNMPAAGAEAPADLVRGGNTIFFDDFESYKPDEPLARGGWSASFALPGLADAARDGLSSRRERKGALGLDTRAPISGRYSGSVSIPAHATLTLAKPISWPERRPFAVSAKPFAIVHQTETEADDGQDTRVLPEREFQDRINDAGSADLELRGPHSGMPASVPPGRATLYATTYYIHSFDGKLLAEYDSTGACVKDYIYMGNRLIAEYQPATGKYYYYTPDQINSTRIITDSSGAVVYSAMFDPYGGMQKQWVNTYQPSLKFSGKEREAKSELDYFGARYYDHTKYRFLSVDPVINKDEALTNLQLWNLYSYCRNNPVTFSNPNGTYEKDVHYFLTKYLALQAGFSKSDAEIIASANQRIDDNRKTSANPTSALRKGFDAQKRAWHFASNERVSEALGQAFASGDLSQLGAALHCYQDSLFAHKKCRELASHFGDSQFLITDPDNTANNVGMALEMAQGTLNILNFFWKRNEYKSTDSDFLSKVFSNPISPLRSEMISEAE